MEEACQEAGRPLTLTGARERLPQSSVPHKESPPVLQLVSNISQWGWRTSRSLPLMGMTLLLGTCQKAGATCSFALKSPWGASRLPVPDCTGGGAIRGRGTSSLPHMVSCDLDGGAGTPPPPQAPSQVHQDLVHM